MATHSPWGSIRVRGARENNLRDVSLDIPKRQLTVFTGVSGSGKSSLVFETIAAESQRLINETYSAFLQGFMATPPRPDVEQLGADWVIDLGPGAGHDGGRVVYSGPPDGLARSGTLTGEQLARRVAVAA